MISKTEAQEAEGLKDVIMTHEDEAVQQAPASQPFSPAPGQGQAESSDDIEDQCSHQAAEEKEVAQEQNDENSSWDPKSDSDEEEDQAVDEA